MNKKLILFSIIIALFSAYFFLAVRPSMGTNPDKDRVASYKSLSNYNFEKEIFVNRKPEIIENMTKRNMNFQTAIDFIKGRPNLKPNKKLPTINPDLKTFLAPTNRFRVIWLGHSSFLLNFENKIILVDPIFSDAASPVPFFVRRFQKPVLDLAELPKIDYILISHDHFDHLDMETILYFKNQKTLYITPLGVGSHIENWGIDSNRIIEKNWWESFEVKSLKFIATPAQHFSGRGPFDAAKTLWASWVIEGENSKIYFSGDSGYDIHFKEIGEKHGPFDLAFIENGQYNKRWEEVHLLPDQSVQAFKDLGAKKYFPVHWGMFILSLHTWDEPINEIYRRKDEHSIDLIAPQMGEIFDIEKPFTLKTWWK